MTLLLDIHEKDHNKNKLFKNIKYVLESNITNLQFWITSLVCVFLLQDHSFISSCISLGLAMLVGYIVHYLSHSYDVIALYESSFFYDYIKQFRYIDKYLKYYFMYTFDFHDKIHHNTAINKQPLHIIIECIQNIMTQGGILAILSKYVSLHIGTYAFRINPYIVMLWACLYTTVHHINYPILSNIQHEQHHINNKTNYGIDVLDILFDTKYDVEDIEDINHSCINLVIITLIFFYLKYYFFRDKH